MLKTIIVMVSVRLLFLCVYTSALSVNYIPESRTPPPHRELSGIAFDSAENKVYIYGGRSEIIYGDMWEFDLTNETWNELHPASVIRPGPRSAAHLTILDDSRQMVLFGGNTESGPISDVWLYNLDSEYVTFIQWLPAFTKGKAPPRAYYRAVCSYMHEERHYLAVYGGKDRSDFITDLHILDLETLIWNKLPDSEYGPEITGEQMDYYEGSLYIYSGNTLYIYSLDTNLWTEAAPSSDYDTFLTDYSQCIYDNSLYLILGWDEVKAAPSNTIYKIDLSDEEYLFEEITIEYEDVSESLMGFACNDNLAYIFGGSKEIDGFSNDLSILDLSQEDLEFEILSDYFIVPTARRGHVMEVYDDKIYIFGGVDSTKESLMDMWTYDINREFWSPVSFKSTVVPSPRSEFAHARYQDDFIIFGGMGDTELFSDIYRFSTRSQEWEEIGSESDSVPSARRAACMAASDEFILIFGGIEASGYSNELWKFEWGTHNFTLLESERYIPGAAYSQCHMDRNSDNQIVFKVYTGETYGKTNISFIYEYNLAINKWKTIQDWAIDTQIGRSKAAVFMINDIIISAGGIIMNFASFNTIFTLNINSPEEPPAEVGSLPANTFYGASIYYKNKIYIHGGGYSFGDLPLSSIVTNDLIVINLNEDCKDSEDFCIDACSKGTAFNSGDCDLCPMGSYSDIVGSTKCEQCEVGYFSQVIGAETSKTCKPCPYGYFNDQKGQSKCLYCPSDSICSVDQAVQDDAEQIIRYNSIQPDLLDYKTETVAENSMIFYIVISILLLIFLAVFLKFKKTRAFLTNIDMYSQQHNYEEDYPMYIRKTLIGGVFTAAFVFAALAIIFTMFLTYAIDNIRETKALVPLAALEQQYDSVIVI